MKRNLDSQTLFNSFGCKSKTPKKTMKLLKKCQKWLMMKMSIKWRKKTMIMKMWRKRIQIKWTLKPLYYPNNRIEVKQITVLTTTIVITLILFNKWCLKCKLCSNRETIIINRTSKIYCNKWCSNSKRNSLLIFLKFSQMNF